MSNANAVAAELPYAIEWAAQVGTAFTDQSAAVAVDGSGNTYISGTTGGSLGATNAGGSDVFLTKIDASGGVLWSRQVGTSSSDGGRAVAVDGSGNAYITGKTDGSLGGTSEGSTDAFLFKFDASGNQVWSRQIGTTGIDDGMSVAVDTTGNVYVTGSTEGSLGGTNAGLDDVFLIKYDPSGNQVWSRQTGTFDYEYGQSVAVDGSGNVYISGIAYGDFGGTHAGGSDPFLVKYDASGNQVWTRQIGTASSDQGHSVAVDGSGNVYISGYTNGSLGGTNAGSLDAFLTKFDASGNVLWSQQIGTAGDDRCFAVAVDGSGNVFISGFTEGSLEGTNMGSADAFLTKFDASGNLVWTEQFGTAGTDESHALAVDSLGNVYSSGYTRGSLGGTNAGNFDAFLVKFAVPEPASVSLLALGGLALLRRGR